MGGIPEQNAIQELESRVKMLEERLDNYAKHRFGQPMIFGPIPQEVTISLDDFSKANLTSKEPQ